MIVIFNNQQILKHYFLSANTIDYIIDCDGDLKVDDFENGLIKTLYQFSFAEKEEIVSQYIETISDLGADNNYSLYWLCHPVSEKNDLIPHHLLIQLSEFISFYRIFESLKDRKLAIYTKKKWFLKHIVKYFSKNKIAYQANYNVNSKSPTINNYQNIKSKIRYISENFKKIPYSIGMLNKFDRNKSYTIIRTWFDFGLNNKFDPDKDTYFGKLPALLKEKGKYVIFLGEILNISDTKIQKQFENETDYSIIFSDSLVSLRDSIKLYSFKLELPQKIRLKDKIILLKIDIKFIFENFINSPSQIEAASYNYGSYLAIKKLLSKLKIETFYNLFENYAWEKATNLAIKKYSPRTNLIAFQHAQIAPCSTKFFLGKREAEQTILPDKIVTLGNVTREILIDNNYPEDRVITGCALRHDYPKFKKINFRKRINTILVILWTFQKSIQLLEFLYLSKIFQQIEYKFIIRTHPNHPYRSLKPYLQYSILNNQKISKSTLKNDIEESDLAIYNGSTACLDALFCGLPLINVDLGDFKSTDPLFSFNDFKINVTNASELYNAISFFYDINTQEYYQRQTAGFEFARKYFYPVTKENLKVFLE